METAWPDDGTFPGVRSLARQLITEFGEQAAAMAWSKAQESRTQDEAQRWLLVFNAVNSLTPGEQLPR